jgi:phosphoribosylaminoimidazole synthetase
LGNAYARAGVDVEAGYEVVRRIKGHAARTERLGVMGALGGFGGCFDLSGYNLKEPVLVSGTDGVGTKLMLAQSAGVHDTIGIDCVAMCVNDIVAQGAEPLYFLDYIACGSNDPEVLEQVVAGVAEGCVQAGAALIGGETAEMPGMYDADEYDLAGFAVGIAEKTDLVTGENVAAGDVLIGLPSTGVHSNGFSLVRKVFENEPADSPWTKSLLVPTKIYVSALLPLVKSHLVNGIAHVTGGGFVENLPRMLPDGLGVKVDLGSWPILPVFDEISKRGDIPLLEMFEIFNMGIGMVLAVSPENVAAVKESLTKRNEEFFEIGSVTDLTDTEPVVFVETGTH